MCTVTFVPIESGYHLAMNRDEQLTRVRGLPPERGEEMGRRFVCPAEPSGGTWISLNDAGFTFALINWYSVKRRVERYRVSRGEIIRGVRTSISHEQTSAKLRGMPLGRINPFRLIGVLPGSHRVVEWRWDLERLTTTLHPWQVFQWISSGFDEAKAQIERTRTLQRMHAQKSFGSLNWLRKLHASHLPEPGPFSVCMHRPDAATVSYTEVSVTDNHSRMIYMRGPACGCGRLNRVGLRTQPAQYT